MNLDELRDLVQQVIAANVRRSMRAGCSDPNIARLIATENMVTDLTRCVVSGNCNQSLEWVAELWREEIAAEKMEKAA
ncbi:MAG: hypothetical protein ACOC0Q_07365 [Wenzhouxiangella sp.]